MQGKSLEIAIGAVGHVTIDDAESVLNRIDGMKDLNAIVAAMTGRLYHGTDAADSVRVAALRNRLRASKGQNHTKQDIIDQLQRDLVRYDEARAEVSRLESELFQSHRVTETYRQALADSDRDLKVARDIIAQHKWRLDSYEQSIPVLAAVDDETMLREMAAEDAARPNPVTEDIIKEAAAILGDPPLSDTDAAKMRDAMRADAGVAALGVDPLHWTSVAARRELRDQLENGGVRVPMYLICEWSENQCSAARAYITTGGNAPDFLAHCAPTIPPERANEG